MRPIEAFVAVGVPIEALIDATVAGQIDFESYPALHGDPGLPSTVPYGEFRGRQPGGSERMTSNVRGLRPRGTGPLDPPVSRGEELLTAGAERLAGLQDVDLAMRLLRLGGEAAGRTTSAHLDVSDRHPGEFRRQWSGAARSVKALGLGAPRAEATCR